MNAPHWHLAINHIPVVGVFLVALLLGYALIRGRGELYGVSLGALVLVALATVPVFFTGRAADNALMEMVDLDEKLVGAHEAAATIALIGVMALGALTLSVLWFGRRLPHVPRGVAAMIFVLAVAESALLARAANLGGNIRHPEIRPAIPAAAPPAKDGRQ